MALNEADQSLNQAISKAQEGDRDALEQVIRSIQSLIRVVTRLSTFRGDSAFSTWVYRVAVNHLMDCRRSRLEIQTISFDEFGKDLQEGLASPPERADDSLLYQEIRIGCTLAMLSCLDRPHRIAYILGDVLDMTGPDAAAIVGVEPAAFRKRLERARRSIVHFMKQKCGLVNPRNACRCSKRVQRAIELKRVNPEEPLFAGDRQNASEFPIVLTKIRQLEDMQRAVALYRSHPEYQAPDFSAAIRALVSEAL